jgi:negative regulator of sigma E activity
MKPCRIDTKPFSASKPLGLVALFCLLLNAWFMAQAQAQTPSGEALLRAMAQAEQNAEYVATRTVTRVGAQPMTMRVWRSGFRRRIEWQAPPVMRGDVLVDNGSIVWRYHRAENEAVATRSTVGDRDLEQLSQRFDAKVQGSAEVSGRTAWIVNVSPRGQNRVVRRLWLDRATKIVLRTESFDAGGQRVETSSFNAIQFSKVGAEQFRWTPPRGAQVTRTSGTLWTHIAPAKRAAPWLQVPSQSTLPRGYVVESAVVDTKAANGQGEAWLRYTNGLNRFSIFQQRAPNAANKELQKVDGAWFWTSNGFRFLVAGLDEKSVQKLLNSLR